MVKVMKIWRPPSKIPCMHCHTQCPDPVAGHSCTSVGDSWTPQASLDQFLVGSLLLSPGSWCIQGSVCTLPESVPSPVYVLAALWWVIGDILQ